MAESPMAGGHRVSKARQSLPVQQSVAMRDSMALFLQVWYLIFDHNLLPNICAGRTGLSLATESTC